MHSALQFALPFTACSLYSTESGSGYSLFIPRVSSRLRDCWRDFSPAPHPFWPRKIGLTSEEELQSLEIEAGWERGWFGEPRLSGQVKIIFEIIEGCFETLKVLVTQSYLTLCDPMDCSPPGFSVLGILQTRILEWVAIRFSRRSSPPRDQTQVSCLAGTFFTI